MIRLLARVLQEGVQFWYETSTVKGGGVGRDRVLARISKVAVQNNFVGVATYLCGRGHMFLGVATIFCC